MDRSFCWQHQRICLSSSHLGDFNMGNIIQQPLMFCWNWNFSQHRTWICLLKFVKEISWLLNFVIYTIDHWLNKTEKLIWSNFLWPYFICCWFKSRINGYKYIFKRIARFYWDVKILVMLFILNSWRKCPNLMPNQFIGPSF